MRPGVKFMRHQKHLRNGENVAQNQKHSRDSLPRETSINNYRIDHRCFEARAPYVFAVLSRAASDLRL